jgi:23S rRNA pseudouridine1911/1915/1917 synthase
MNIITVTIDTAQAGQRLDKALATLCPDLSRARIQALIDDDHVTFNGAPATQASRKVADGEVFVIRVPDAVEAVPAPENIPLNIVYEDNDLLVINKSPDMVVHPGAGNSDGTLVNALLAHCGDSLSGIGGVKRPGIVHRLDKETSGLMVVAKNDAAHQGLSEQLSSRTLKRVYNAIVWGGVSPAAGTISTQIGRSPKHRQKMAVLASGGRSAVTHYKIEKSFAPLASLVECRLETGRTHQIRVHMAHLGFPLIGDPVYGKSSPSQFLKLHKVDESLGKALLGFQRQALHAAQLEFVHPISKNNHHFKAPLPEDMYNLLTQLDKKSLPKGKTS